MPSSPDPTFIARFSAWVWDPSAVGRERGFPTAHLDVYRGRLQAYPNAAARSLGRSWNVNYNWPTIVVENLRPLGGPGLLVDIDGKLGRVTLAGRRKATRLRAALHDAGFTIVEVRRLGWEAPRPVDPTILGSHVGEVPEAIIANAP